jgi:nucleoside-diphosphate kinase
MKPAAHSRPGRANAQPFPAAPQQARLLPGRGGSPMAPGKRLKDSRTMAIERTLSIIKPDATRRNLTGKINAKFEDAGLRIVAQRRIKLTQTQAEEFYAVHKERPFFGGLVSFMTSGPVVVQVLEGEDAVAANRRIMGATDPKKAEAGTIRAEFAEDIEANSVHGSDSAENAAIEIAFFFTAEEILP